MSELKEALSGFIARELSHDESSETVGVDENLLMSGRVDSLGMMRLVAFIDEHFQVSVPPEDVTIENFMTITSIAKYIEGHQD